MTSTTWTTACATAATTISLHELDKELERIPDLSEDERDAIWLFAWASRETAGRVSALALAA